MCELIERCCKRDKEDRRHNEAILIHWKVVVDTMEEEMGCDSNAVTRYISMRVNRLQKII